MEFLKSFEIPAEIQKNHLVSQALLPFKFCGIVLYYSDKHKLFHFLRGFLFITIAFSGTILQMYALQQSSSYDLNKMILPISCTMVILSNNCQFIKFLVSFKDFFNLVSYVGEHLNNLQKAKRPSERQLYKDFMFYSNFIFKFIIGSISCSVSLSIGEWLVTMFRKPEIFQDGFILDYEDTPFLLLMYPFKNLTNNFWIIYILPLILSLCAAICIAAWTIIIINLLLFPIYDLKFLNLQLENLGDIPHSKLREEMILLVQIQIRIKEYIGKIFSFISSLIFIDFILFSICICLMLFYFTESKFERSTNSLIMVIGFVVVCVTQFVYHAIATEICYQWSTLSTSFYLSTWYEFSLPVKKMGLLMMIYSTRPIQLQAVFIDMHLTTFVSIMQGAYGYFNVLRNINHA